MKICFSVGIILPCYTAADQASSPQTQAFLQSDLDLRNAKGKMRSSRIPDLALGIVKKGEIAYLKSYGHAGEGRNVSPQTPFMIGSFSKPITAAATMQLAETGLLELDAPVREYLPWFEMAGKYDVSTMTVRHLLVQASDMPWEARPFYPG